MHQFQSLRYHLHIRLGHACDVAVWPVQTADEAELDRVAARFEDDRYSFGRGLCRKCRRSAGRSNHGHLTVYQIGRHGRQPIAATLRPPVFDNYVTAINVTGFAQPFEKGRGLSRVTLGRSEVEKTNNRHRRLLRTCRKRPRRRRTKKRDELASPHCLPPRLRHVTVAIYTGTREGVGLGDVRFGSKADMCGAIRYVRFAPNSGHVRCN